MTTRKQATSCTNSSHNSSTSSKNSSDENLHEKMLQLALRNDETQKFPENTSKIQHVQQLQKHPRIRRSVSLYTRSKTLEKLENVKNLKNDLKIENSEISAVPPKLSRSKSLKIAKNDDNSQSVYPNFSFKSFMAEFRENIRNSDDKMIDSLLKPDSRQLNSRFTEKIRNNSKIPNPRPLKSDLEEDTIFNPVKAYRNQRNFANVNLNASFGGNANAKRQMTISRTRSLGYRKNNHKKLSMLNSDT